MFRSILMSDNLFPSLFHLYEARDASNVPRQYCHISRKSEIQQKVRETTAHDTTDYSVIKYGVVKKSGKEIRRKKNKENI